MCRAGDLIPEVTFARMFQILSSTQLKHLEEYKYHGARPTLTERMILARYWDWLVKQVPLWLAPNVMTLMGLMLNIFIVSVMIYYCPTGKEQAPGWVYLACFAAYFTFQSLDGIDGKQARRTNTGSALGELMDHGCDTFSMITATIAACLTLQLGSLMYVIVPMYGIFEQFCARWQNCVTGVREFGLFDHVEIEVYTMLIFLLPGLFGADVYDTKVPLLGLPLKALAVSVYFCFTAFACSRYFSILLSEGFGKKALQFVLSPLLAMLPVALLAGLIWTLSDDALLESKPGLYLLLLGTVSTKVLNKQLIALLVKSDIEYFDCVLIWPVLMLLNLCLNNVIDEAVVLYMCLIISSIDVAFHSGVVVKQMSDFLGVELLRISHRADRKG
ncbi:choline/ethanolaminephosphotransferase 1-like [Ptychodera flava]|uniref:choline/ethanolaminephosphotransferase 1-like n=1 Tax=Ptychodera flava TaxID=63121 RepID=UPI00396A5F74